MADAVDDHLVATSAIEYQIWIGRDYETAEPGAADAMSGVRVLQQQIDDVAHAPLDVRGALGRLRRNRVEDRFKFRRRPLRIAEPHRPCFAQIAVILASEANSPRNS